MQYVAVLDGLGKPLMPTNAVRARKLLKKHKAIIEKYRPIFTIRLTEREDGDVQPVELKCDAGYAHIGISIASESREYVNEQRDLLKTEKEHHADSRKYRRARRNRLRYRKPRFLNRKGKISKDGFAPSIRNKRDIHVSLIKGYCDVLPIKDVYIEMGQFDTQVLKAMEEGKPLPEGEDYQQGEQYGYATLREAVFARDDYKCICCGKSANKDKVILCIHHLGFKTGDRSNRMGNLASVCSKCHTSKNHKPGGKLFVLEPKLKTFKGASFMNQVKWSLLSLVKETASDVNVHVTYGAATKLARNALGISKTHSNDAYCMGTFHPKHRTEFKHFEKQRRNNRILEKFYDAKYIDIRDKSVKTGCMLSCGRTNRREKRNTEKSERIFRGKKTSKGRRSIRKTRYNLRPGDIVLLEGKRYSVKGVHCNGANAILSSGKSVSVRKLILKYHIGAWKIV